ncbi:MAG TPA: hypothetical protein DDZ80_08505 [Cyanobacteria bacterium UBA8803]|nr:hypothetical protein [Cyanobacteria bacterium UBA9273]HBL58542.1 hypothetical protein [Cyanobacteria bacterium UBA8803]
MANLDKETKPKSSKLSFFILNFLIIAFASAIIIGSLSYLIIRDFSYGIGIGMRSLLVILLPIIVIIFIRSFVKVESTEQREVPPFNLFFIFSILTLMAFVTLKLYYSPIIPLAQMLLSLIVILAGTIYKGVHFKALASCSYGIVSGFLAYILLFELPI